MTTTTDRPAIGQRTSSYITIRIGVIHDGPGDLVAQHLALELEAVVDRVDSLDLADCAEVRKVKVLSEGDEFSKHLPAWR